VYEGAGRKFLRLCDYELQIVIQVFKINIKI